jgi:hypothetical protein
MTLRELAAFNEGVRTVLRIAGTVAEAIERTDGYKPTRAGFAVAALRELAEAGQGLLSEKAPRDQSIAEAESS